MVHYLSFARFYNLFGQIYTKRKLGENFTFNSGGKMKKTGDGRQKTGDRRRKSEVDDP